MQWDALSTQLPLAGAVEGFLDSQFACGFPNHQGKTEGSDFPFLLCTGVVFLV